MANSEHHYITRVPLMIPIALLIGGVGFVMTLGSPNSLVLRFSQNFFGNIFTVIPMATIGIDGWIIYQGLKERKIQKRNTTYAIIDIGCIIALIGAGMFIFYVLD